MVIIVDNSKKSANKVFFYLLAFFIPFSILGLVYVKHGMYPFGNKTILICDLSGQYVDFYSAYHEILTQGKSLLYSWQAGLGLNFLGLFSYYLASPFSLLIIFLPKQHLTEALLLITLLKVGASGLTFALFARYTFQRESILHSQSVLDTHSTTNLQLERSAHSVWEHKLTLLIFSVLYALMAYSVVYSFNLMWLDGVIFLPLVLLGTEKILRENKYLIFLVSLILIFIANYYISYMVGIFSFLYFLAAFFSRHLFSVQKIRLLARKLILFLFSALLAAGCAAALLIPTFFALRNGQGGPSLSAIFEWQLNFKLFDLLPKALPGSYDTLQNGGLPNIYCGLLPLLLLPLYYGNKNIPVKEKSIYSGLLVFLVFSFNFSNLDIIWHAFDRPDWFPHRYSFVFSFLLIFMALRSISNLEHSDLSRMAKAGIFWIVLVIIMQKLNSACLSQKMLMISLFLLGSYSLLLAGRLKASNTKARFLLLILAGFIALEASLNTWYLIAKMDEEFQYVTKQDYERTLTKLEPLIAELQTADQDFFRVERIGGRTFNDPLNLDYNGLAHFSSMSNSEVYRALRQLGFLTTAGYKSVNFAGSTAITESLLAIKYVLSAQDKGLGYQEMITGSEFHAYKNNYVLPLAFLTDQALLKFDPTKDDNPFTLQNTFVNLALGQTTETKFQDYFLPVNVKNTNFSNSFLNEEEGKEVIGRINTSQDAAVEYTLVNPREGQVYACFQTITNEVRIFLNDQEIKGYLPVYNKRIIDLGFHPRGEELRVKLSFRNQGFTLAKKYFYNLNEASLAAGLNPLQNNALADMQITDTAVRGNVTVQGPSKNLLFTSIPYDPGWEAFIDGNKVPVSKIGRAFLGIELPEGQHEIQLLFTPKGLAAGRIISGLSLGILLVLIAFSVWPAHQPGQY